MRNERRKRVQEWEEVLLLYWLGLGTAQRSISGRDAQVAFSAPEENGKDLCCLQLYKVVLRVEHSVRYKYEARIYCTE